MAGFEKLNSTKSAPREGLSVGSSLSVSFSFHYNLGPLTFWFGWHNSATQVLSLLEFVVILWNFHAVTQCRLIKSIHLYPPATLPIVCYPISLPTSCVPFSLLLITLGMQVVLLTWGHLLRHGPPTSSPISKEECFSHPQQSSTVNGFYSKRGASPSHVSHHC